MGACIFICIVHQVHPTLDILRQCTTSTDSSILRAWRTSSIGIIIKLMKVMMRFCYESNFPSRSLEAKFETDEVFPSAIIRRDEHDCCFCVWCRVRRESGFDWRRRLKACVSGRAIHGADWLEIRMPTLFKPPGRCLQGWPGSESEDLEGCKVVRDV